MPKLYQCMPEQVLHHFKMGGFATSFTGANFSCVAADECHECTINKDTKAVITHIPPTDITNLVGMLEFQAYIMNNYFKQAAVV